MKKIVIAALAATVFAAPAFAQSSGTAVISGQIAQNCTITAPAGSTTLDLASAAEQAIGDIAFSCNATSYSVKATSANAGKLSAGSKSNFYNYQIVTGTTVQSLATEATLPTNTRFTGLGGGVFDRTLGLKVKLAGVTGAAYAGTYSDTITLSIAAN